MPETDFRYFEFGEFRLDSHRRILYKSGKPLHLSPRIFDLLRVLVENHGRVLAHDELLDKVWEGAFVEQSNLKKSVSALRQALGESADASEFITTVPRKGYRFTAPVRGLNDEAEAIYVRETRAEIYVEEEIEEPDEAYLKTVSPLQIESRKTRRFQARGIAFAGAAILVLATFALSAWLFFRHPPQRFSAENVRLTRLAAADSLGEGALSADGGFFVYTVKENGKTGLWAKQTATGGTSQIVQPIAASIWWTTVTPDGNYVYFYLYKEDEPAKSGWYRVPTLGGVMQLITEKKYAGIKFSPDGERLAAVYTFVEEGKERQELLILNRDGNGERRLLVLPFWSLFRGFNWSPDGASVLYGVKKQGPFDKPSSYAAEIPADGGAEKIVMPEQEKVFSVAGWMPDKNSFLLLQRELNAEIFQIWQYFPVSSEMRRVTNDDYSYRNVNITADGKTIGAARSFGLSSIWISENGQSEQRQIASGNGFFYVSWTGDDRLVFSLTENHCESVGIMNQDGGQKRILTTGEDGIRTKPGVSADGRQIVFISDRGGSRQAWRMDLEGRNLTPLTNVLGLGYADLLSDSQTVVYDAYQKPGEWSLLKQTSAGDAAQLVENMHEWSVSPDEKLLAVCVLDEKTKKNRLDIRELANGAVVKSFDCEKRGNLRWTRDGRALSYIRIGSGVYDIVRLSLADGDEEVLASVRGEAITSFDWSADGGKLAFVRHKSIGEAVMIKADAEK